MPTAQANLDGALAFKSRKRRIEDRRENLAHAVGAEIEAENAVAVAHAAIVADHRRDDELVELLVRIGRGDDRAGIGKARRRRRPPSRHRPCHALPALVAVHRIVAPAHRRDRDRLRQRGREARDVVAGRLRRRIAAVGPGMHQRRHAGGGENFREADRMVLMRMHAAGRHQAHQVTGAAVRLEASRSGPAAPAAVRSRRSRSRRRSRGRSCITTRPAPMLRWPTSELPIWPPRQADVLAGRVQQRVRAGRPQPVEIGRARLLDGVVGGVLAPTPTVQNGQHHGTSPLHPQGSLCQPALQADRRTACSA